MPSDREDSGVDRSGAVCYKSRCTGEPTHRVQWERGDRWYGICEDCADDVPLRRGTVLEGLTPETITTHPVATDGGTEQPGVGLRDTVETVVGSMVLETPKRVYNPVSDEYRDMRQLSEDGYCRRFLAVLSAMNSVDTINVDESPVLTFDTDRWELRESEGQIVLVKREPEARFEELVLDASDTQSMGSEDQE